MKESFARLAAWAKEHPYYTAAILGGLILLVYLTIKRGGGGGGFSGGGDTGTPPEDGAASNDIGSGSFANLGTPGQDTTTPTDNTPAPIGAGGGGGGDGGFSGGGQSNDYSMSDPVDYVVPPSSYAISQGAPVSSQGMNSLALQATASSGVKGATPGDKKTVQATASSGVKGATPGDKKTVQASASSGVKGVTPQDKKTVQASASSGTKTGGTKPPKPVTTARPKTQAELLGLPRLYNGYYNGFIYVLGMRLITTPAASGNKGGAVKGR